MLAHIFKAARIDALIVDPEMLVEGISTSRFLSVVLTEEALLGTPIPPLEAALAAQPVWSDLHFIVLTARGEPSPRLDTLSRLLGNVSRCERPAHPASLVALLRVAARARARQYETRQYLEQRERAQAELRRLTDSLETQVAERTEALAANADRLAAEVRERAEMQERIVQMQAELIHVSRLSAMGTMASTLAHELNQPLSAVSNYVGGSNRLLRAGHAQVSPAIFEALDGAAANAHRAGEIVRRLRELVSRGEVTHRKEDLTMLIDEALVIATVDATALGVDCTLDLDPAAAQVDVDKVQIQQVLINLIRNAVEAMRSVKRREILISSRKIDRRMIEVTVADSGPGLTMQTLETLFSPFITTKAEGLGIGLSISRTIVESHGGTIVGENCQSGGALFRFTIPAHGG